MSDDSKPFVQRTLVLPRRLWDGIEAMAQAQAKEPSEIVADALRLLLAGGVPAAPASVGGTAPGRSGAFADALPLAGDPSASMTGPGASAPAVGFADLAGEPLASPALRERLERLVRQVEERDQFTEPHGAAVAALAVRTATALGLDEVQTRVVELAALAHDIGKSRLPDEILSKRGRLTADEYRLVQRYPEYGAEILGTVPALEQVARLVGAHQERWDGSGYPRGLQGDAIPLGAQIVGLCDVFHVLTAERAYRPALSPQIARRTIEGGLGRLWSPELAHVFLTRVLE